MSTYEAEEPDVQGNWQVWVYQRLRESKLADEAKLIEEAKAPVRHSTHAKAVAEFLEYLDPAAPSATIISISLVRLHEKNAHVVARWDSSLREVRLCYREFGEPEKFVSHVQTLDCRAKPLDTRFGVEAAAPKICAAFASIFESPGVLDFEEKNLEDFGPLRRALEA